MGKIPSQFQVFAKSTVWISNQESYDVIGDSRIQIYGLNPQIMRFQRPSRIAKYRRSITVDLLPGEARGYWKHHSRGKWFRQAKITGKIHNEKAILLLDTGAEVSILDITFACKVGCYIDPSQIQDCVGIGDKVFRTEGRTRIKVTLAGLLVYFFDIWVGDLTSQQAILGMDCIVPAGIRVDLAHGSISLPDEVRIQLSGRQQLYSDKAKIVNVGQHLRIHAGESVELPLRLRSSIHDKLWVTRGDQWVPTISDGPGRTKYISITNIKDEVLILHQDLRIGIWLAGDHVPRTPSFISIGSRRYMEWQNQALETTTDAQSEDMKINIPFTPTVERSEPKTTSIQSQRVKASQAQDIPDYPPSDTSPPEIRPLDLALSQVRGQTVAYSRQRLCIASCNGQGGAGRSRSDIAKRLDDGSAVGRAYKCSEEEGRDGIEVANLDQLHLRCQDQGTSPSKYGESDQSSMMSVQSGTGHVASDPLDGKYVASMSQKTDMDPPPAIEDQPDASDLDLTWSSDQDYDECVYYHEGSDLYAEDVDGQIAVLPEVPVTTEDVKIEDIQLCGSDDQTPDEIVRLRQRIWKFRLLLISQGNALPPAARGVVCDIDVGGARPIDLKYRKMRIQFREKLADLIKGLLSAKMVNYSRSPWASPIVVIIKKNGVDIRLCIDYRLVNSLTQLMIYPMPLINCLLEDLESTL
ncbi:hypothetical protein PHMEG_00033437, partial [Phytophthora megakarya]